MEKFDKIFDLLEKKSRTDQETTFLNNSIKSDKEVEKLVAVFRSLENNLPDSIHIDLEILASYILYENSEDPEDKTVLLLKDKISEHLSHCNSCRLEYESLKQEYILAGEFVNSVISNKEKANAGQNLSQGFLKSFSTFRYVFASLIALVLIYSGLLIYSNSSIEDYKTELFKTGSEGVYSTRGRTSLIFQKGLDAVEHGDYESAEKYFKDDIKENKNDKSIFYTYYVLGITQLHSSENSFIGLFKNYDEQKVDEAISSLDKSIKLNTSGSYGNINLDAHYYLGRAFLLEDDIENAEQNLEIVVDKKGRFFNEAQELIDEINSNK